MKSGRVQERSGRCTYPPLSPKVSKAGREREGAHPKEGAISLTAREGQSTPMGAKPCISEAREIKRKAEQVYPQLCIPSVLAKGSIASSGREGAKPCPHTGMQPH